jgi:hypothetical protein
LTTEPSLGGLSTEDADVHRAFLGAAKKSCEGFVIFTIVNKAEVCYMDNWMKLAHEVAARELPLGGWAPTIVFALDKVALDSCSELRTHHSSQSSGKLNVRCVKHPHYKEDDVRVHYGSQKYKAIVWTKTSFVKVAVDMGIPVLLMDLDITVMKNPSLFRIDDGFTVQTTNEDGDLIKPNTGFVSIPGWHVGGGYWTTTAQMKQFAATWNASQDETWDAEAFECWEGPASGNPQNEQGALYRQHLIVSTDFRKDLRPESWGRPGKKQCVAESKIPRVFKAFNWSRPWDHGSPLAPGGIEWRVFPIDTFDSSDMLRSAVALKGRAPGRAQSYKFGQVVLMHYVNVDSKVEMMEAAGLWRPIIFTDRKKWCSYDAR